MIVELPNESELIMACHITGVYDVNRNNTLQDNDYSLVKDWVESIAELKLRGILFHNNFTDELCEELKNDFVHFQRISYHSKFNPNVFRYFVYQDFLNTNAHKIKSLFITDVSDVVVINNPFIHPLFTNNPNALFCGDEPSKLENEWMRNHSTHLRNRIKDYVDFENHFKESALLNCGIIGGNIKIMKIFIDKLCATHANYNEDNTTAYTGDMGAFIYLIRTQFNNQVLHGAPINTIFKGYESSRRDCWFRHK